MRMLLNIMRWHKTCVCIAM